VGRGKEKEKRSPVEWGVLCKIKKEFLIPAKNLWVYVPRSGVLEELVAEFAKGGERDSTILRKHHFLTQKTSEKKKGRLPL